MAVQVLASNEIPWKPIESSNLEAYHYDQAQEALYIKFKPSKKSPNAFYIYPEVKQEVVTAFEGAESHGKFFIAEIKPHYDADRFIRVDPDAVPSQGETAAAPQKAPKDKEYKPNYDAHFDSDDKG